LRRLRKVQLDPGLEVVEGLVVYYDLLRRWNEKINLTSLPPGDEAIDRLLVEPLVAAQLLTEQTTLILDIGSGGGSPAIPLQLAAPTVSVWMVESKARKAAFLREAVRQLGLRSVVETHRFEDLVERPELFALVDVISIRAVRADLKALAALQQLLRPGGEVFFFTRLGSADRILLPPQLRVAGESPLVPALQSALVRFRKRDSVTDAAGVVPRGTAPR
jgi:16S rRNA (guanine527-N7)-methyltransferase